MTVGLGRPSQGCIVGVGICSNFHGNLMTVQVAFALYQPPPWLCAPAVRRKAVPRVLQPPVLALCLGVILVETQYRRWYYLNRRLYNKSSM